MFPYDTPSIYVSLDFLPNIFVLLFSLILAVLILAGILVLNYAVAYIFYFIFNPSDASDDFIKHMKWIYNCFKKKK